MTQTTQEERRQKSYELSPAFAQELRDLHDAIEEASMPRHINRYLPNLQSPAPAGCLLLYVTRPMAESELSECITVETPVELGIRMLGGLRPDEIIGIFPVAQALEALDFALSAWLRRPAGEE